MDVTDVNNIITSGSSDLDKTLRWAGIETPPVGGILMMPGGSVKLMLGSPDEAVEDMDMEEWAQASTCLGFLMYALNRKDWMVDYMMYEKELEGLIEEGFKEMEKNRMRSKLRVIVGGKTAAEVEDGGDLKS